jgi:hypothetical protein
MGIGGDGFGGDNCIVHAMNIFEIIKRRTDLRKCICGRYAFCCRCAFSDNEVQSCHDQNEMHHWCLDSIHHDNQASGALYFTSYGASADFIILCVYKSCFSFKLAPALPTKSFIATSTPLAHRAMH